MLQFGLALFGFALMFVLMSATRNKRETRKNSRMLTATGYVLVGLATGASAMLLIATQSSSAAATVLNLLS